MVLLDAALSSDPNFVSLFFFLSDRQGEGEKESGCGRVREKRRVGAGG